MSILTFILDLLNAPLGALVSLVQSLLTEKVDIGIFHSIWGIIVYLISMFYGLFFIFAGFNFMISGYDAEKRTKAKEWFRNVVLMILFVQGSFLIYSLLLDLSAGLSSGAMNLIDQNFFLLTFDNFLNIGLELLFLVFYVIILLFTVTVLTVRYILVSAGVIFLPLGIFLYFIPPLKEYGKLILNILASFAFLPFVLILILLAASKLVDVSIFASSFKIVIMIAAFTFVDLITILVAIFVAMKAASSFTGGFGKTIVTFVKSVL